jgi:hypothetical protein
MPLSNQAREALEAIPGVRHVEVFDGSPDTKAHFAVQLFFEDKVISFNSQTEIEVFVHIT